MSYIFLLSLHRSRLLGCEGDKKLHKISIVFFFFCDSVFLQHTKRKLDDVSKRLEALYDKLREQKVSYPICCSLKESVAILFQLVRYFVLTSNWIGSCFILVSAPRTTKS